jgi:hypothetical protein
VDTQLEPLYLSMRANTNTGENFLDFITLAIAQGYLRAGDILILDNAAVHFDVETAEEGYALLAQNQIEVRRLPVSFLF